MVMFLVFDYINHSFIFCWFAHTQPIPNNNSKLINKQKPLSLFVEVEKMSLKKTSLKKENEEK